MVFANALSWGADNFFPILKGIAIVCAGIAGLGKLYDGSQRRRRQAEAVRIGRPELLRQLTVALTALHERELHNEAGDDEDDEDEDNDEGGQEAGEDAAHEPPTFDPSAWPPPSAPRSAWPAPGAPPGAWPAPEDESTEPTR